MLLSTESARVDVTCARGPATCMAWPHVRLGSGWLPPSRDPADDGPSPPRGPRQPVSARLSVRTSGRMNKSRWSYMHRAAASDLTRRGRMRGGPHTDGSALALRALSLSIHLPSAPALAFLSGRQTPPRPSCPACSSPRLGLPFPVAGSCCRQTACEFDGRHGFGRGLCCCGRCRQG